MFWTNGPRVTWDRMPNLALTFFILFKDDEEKDIISLTTLALLIFLTPWMLSEQIVFARQVKANEEGTDSETYSNWTFARRQTQKGEAFLLGYSINNEISGKIYPLALFSTLFRTVSFAFITSALGYYSVLLYIFVFIGPITLDYVCNKYRQRFVIRGVTSIYSGKETLSPFILEYNSYFFS